MAYESTEVAAVKSQQKIREMVYKHRGTGVSFISQRPREGFEALMMIGEVAYHVRVMATCNTKKSNQEQEERRVWRVLFHHLKAMFEAADSGVIDLRDMIMPYVVTPDGRTISEHIIPRFEETRSINPERLLVAGGARGASEEH